MIIGKKENCFWIHLFGKGFVVKRFRSPDQQSNARREKFAFDLCRKKKVKVPKLYHDFSKKKYIYLLFSYVDGTIAAKLKDPRKAVLGYAKEQKKIHQIETDVIGEPFNEERMSSWEEFIEVETEKALKIHKEKEFLDLDIIGQLLKCIAINRRYYVYNEKPKLLHGDPNLRNFIVDQDSNLKAVIDFEYCKAGDPFYDLGIFNFFNYRADDSLLNSLCLGYFETDKLEDEIIQKINLYSLIAAIRMTAIFLDKSSMPREKINQYKKRIYIFKGKLC